jgi:hypothetical protein
MRMVRLLTAALLLGIIFYSTAQGSTLTLNGFANGHAAVGKPAGGLHLLQIIKTENTGTTLKVAISR